MGRVGGQAAMKKTAQQAAVWLREMAALVGKCESCAHFLRSSGGVTSCEKSGETKPHYSCASYEYEPGALW